MERSWKAITISTNQSRCHTLTMKAGSVWSLQAGSSGINRSGVTVCIVTLLWLLLVSPTSVRSFSQLPPTPPSTASTFHQFPLDTQISSRRGASLAATTETSESNNVCTIQILMSDTGGGHRASANALRDAFDVLYPGKIECDIVDMYTDYGPFWPFNGVVAGYKMMAAYPFTWEIFYRFGDSPFGICLNNVLQETFCFGPFKECMSRPSGTTKKRADLVVSVHPLCQDIPLRILSELDSAGRSREASDRTTPFCTVVTDLGSAHTTWFNPGVDKCFVPSDVLEKAAQQRGLVPSQIVKYGLPIRKGFWSTEESTTAKAIPIDEATKKAMRKELGLDVDFPTVLVVGGGDGMGGIESISMELGNRLGQSGTKLTSQMVVVCGNNEAACKNLENVNWGKGVKVYVKGFVNNMDEWMKASDALVTKAGPGTIAEASICGLPCMLFSYLPGQEEGNIPFVENAGFGTYSGEASEIADTVSSWLENPERLGSMRQAALAAARPHATLDIAKDIAELVFAQKAKQ